VQEILFFVHKVRHQVRRQDDNRASTMQWQVSFFFRLFRFLLLIRKKNIQPNKCHYIHKYLHGNLICHISVTNEEHWKRVAAYFKAGGRRSKQVGLFGLLLLLLAAEYVCVCVSSGSQLCGSHARVHA
jgi:hypothetical protein